jgi:hypothetical protein
MFVLSVRVFSCVAWEVLCIVCVKEFVMSAEDELTQLAAAVALDYGALTTAAQRGDVATLSRILAIHGKSLLADIEDARRHSRLRSTPPQFLGEIVAKDREIERLSGKCGRQTARIAFLTERLGNATHNKRVADRTSAAVRRARLESGVEIRKLRQMLRLANDRLDLAADVIRRKEVAMRQLLGTKIEAAKARRTNQSPTDRMRQILRGASK